MSMRVRILGSGLLLDVFAIGMGTVASIFLVLDVWQSMRVLMAGA